MELHIEHPLLRGTRGQPSRAMPDAAAPPSRRSVDPMHMWAGGGPGRRTEPVEEPLPPLASGLRRSPHWAIGSGTYYRICQGVLTSMLD